MSPKPAEATTAKYCSTQCHNLARHERIATIGPEPPPVDGARWIRLTRGYFALVDEGDYDDLIGHCWTAVKLRSSRSVYAYRKVRNGSSVSMHVQIMGLAPSGMTVDHVDANCTLDNRRCNLRFASSSQQKMNRRKFAGYTSAYKGVCHDKRSGVFTADIKVSGRRRHLGSFRSEVDAALAYDKAARELHAEFGRYNFPLPGEQSALRPEQ